MERMITEDTVIAVAGIGYVGLSMAVLLAQHHKVYAVDVVPEKVELLKRKQSPIVDAEISSFLSEKPLNLTATTDAAAAYAQADYVVVATPTNYDEQTNCFNTSSVESVVKQVLCANQHATIIIKSTIPIGYTQNLRETYHYSKILFSPEFLREGKALYDNLYPSRIVVGADQENPETKRAAEAFAGLLLEGAEKKDVPVVMTGLTEAEAVKLFSNTYLAVRVSYFNELDTFAAQKHLNARQIIEGVGLDPRIGAGYNNPSFGYGGYCLPKDTKQLLSDFQGIPETMISAVVESNRGRKGFIAEQIMRQVQENAEPEQRPTVGIYRLIMKDGSDNFRESAVWDIMDLLKAQNVEVVVYEPILRTESHRGFTVIASLEQFKECSDIIVANRRSGDLEDVAERVYTRDLFSVN